MHVEPTVLQIDDLTIDLARRKVYDRKRNEIVLSALSFDTLRALINAAPAAISADEIIERAWRGAIVSDDAVTQRIRLLRKALGDDPRKPRYIETQRNAGYRLIPPVTDVPDATPAGRNFRYVIAVAVLVLLVAIFMTRPANEALQSTEISPAVPQGPVTADELADSAAELVRQRNPDSLRHAIKLYEQALKLSPDNARIKAELSLALSRLVAWYGEKMEFAHRAEQLAREANLDSPFLEAELALGFSLDSQGRTDAARSAYERAVALDPKHYGARASLAYLLQVQGKLVEALSHNMIAYEYAPPGTLDAQIASCLRLLGFYDVASEWLSRSNQLDPDSAHAAPTMALDLLTRDRISEARDVINAALTRGVEQVELYEYQIIVALMHDNTDLAATIIDNAPASINHRGPFEIWQAVVTALSNSESRDAIDLSAQILSNIDAGETWPENYLYVAILEAAAGRKDNALVALLELESAGYRDFLWLERLPPLAVLREDVIFIEILSNMRTDVQRQNEQVLTASWLPDEFRDTKISP